MNAIKNYLDNMFRNLPNTEEVRRAKAELLQMMEDKYEELIGEGKTENEAVGIVISEFGNLDELAESLGISEAVTENPDEAKPMLSMDRVKEYLEMNNQHSILVPLGIALCIFSVAFNIIADVIKFINLEALGVSAMFLAIGAAVGLFIFAGLKKKQFAEVKRKECSLSIEGAEYVRGERRSFKTSYGLMSSIGICLCILSIVNPIIFGSIPYISSDIGAVLFFLFIALGVFLITSANIKMNGYDRILELNESGKMSEEFVPKSDRKVNKAPIIICAVAAVVIAVSVCGIGIVSSLISGVFVKEDYAVETMATTYEEVADNADEDIRSVKIDADALEVIFKTADGEGLIGVDYTGPKKLKPDVSFENGKLVIKQNASNIRFNTFKLDGPTLEITVGKDTKIDNFEMNIDAGNIKLNGISADYLFGDIDAGNIEIRECAFRKVEFEVNAGNYNIKDSSIGSLNINTDAGNIEIKDTKLENVKIEVDFGSVDIEDLGDVNAYDINCEVDAGAISVGNNTSTGHYKSTGSGAGSIEINVDAGNIDID